MDKKDFQAIDWSNNEYDIAKSLLCANLSEMVYRDIDNSERIGNRSQIVPCDIFSEIIEGDIDYDFGNYLRENRIESIFEKRSEYFVTRGVMIVNDVIFVATRGTELAFSKVFLADMKVNFDCTMIPHNDTKNTFHQGFYNEAIDTLSEFYNVLGSNNIPIYFVGHSLGGAVSAIMNALIVDYSSQSYTFGMPKYCNSPAMNLKLPHAILNKKDLITKLPPSLPPILDRFYRHKICSSELGVYEGLDVFMHHKIDTYIKSIVKVKELYRL